MSARPITMQLPADQFREVADTLGDILRGEAPGAFDIPTQNRTAIVAAWRAHSPRCEYVPESRRHLDRLADALESLSRQEGRRA